MPEASADVGLWVTQAELAELKGVSRQAISSRMTRLEERGHLHPRKAGREKLVRLAEWDFATSEFTDPAKLTGRDTTRAIHGWPSPDTLPPPIDRPATASSAYTEELTRKARYDADLKEMELARQRGELLEADDVRQAMEICAEAVLRELDAIPACADDVAAAVAKSGAAGARELLKQVVREVRVILASSMRIIGTDQEESDAEER